MTALSLKPAALRRLAAGAALAAATLPAWAHEGHGLDGHHWHASDVWGFVVVGVLAAVAVWMSRK